MLIVYRPGQSFIQWEDRSRVNTHNSWPPVSRPVSYEFLRAAEILADPGHPYEHKRFHRIVVKWDVYGRFAKEQLSRERVEREGYAWWNQGKILNRRWSAVYWWDRSSGDNRFGSHRSILVPGNHDAETVLAMAKEEAPWAIGKIQPVLPPDATEYRSLEDLWAEWKFPLVPTGLPRTYGAIRH